MKFHQIGLETTKDAERICGYNLGLLIHIRMYLTRVISCEGMNPQRNVDVALMSGRKSARDNSKKIVINILRNY